MGTPAAAIVLDSLVSVNAAMHKLLLATLRHEKLVAIRDREIAAIQTQYFAGIEISAISIATYEAQIEAYCRLHPEEMAAGAKSIQLANGLMGMRAPSQPALVPLNDKWTPAKIAAKVRELWRSKYFHKPKPPAIDKVKLKKSLDLAQLKECGLKLDDTETFYVELNRLAAADEVPIVEAA